MQILANSMLRDSSYWEKIVLILCDPMDCSPPGSSVHGIIQARILEWIAIPISRGSFRPRDGSPISCIWTGTKAP